MQAKKLTEQDSHYDNLEKMSFQEILVSINHEDQMVALAVNKAIPQIEAFLEKAFERLKKGAKVFYVGAGTSGRLGILDASEIPPTYGVKSVFIGLIAGGDKAIRSAVEAAEDKPNQAWEDMQAYEPKSEDILVGIAASGSTPYVLGAINKARSMSMLTACIVCNQGSEIAAAAEYPIEVLPGPEFVTGSTRMKAGTAQKMVLNMISTSLMIKMGRVKGNKMMDMQLTNKKLVERGSLMIMDLCEGISKEEAEKLLLEQGSVRKAVQFYKGKRDDNRGE